MTQPPPALVVFGGLSGVGKTTLARALTARLGAAYLRIDAIEQTLRSAGLVLDTATSAHDALVERAVAYVRRTTG